jgi:hypothetical protein
MIQNNIIILIKINFEKRLTFKIKMDKTIKKLNEFIKDVNRYVNAIPTILKI